LKLGCMKMCMSIISLIIIVIIHNYTFGSVSYYLIFGNQILPFMYV